MTSAEVGACTQILKDHFGPFVAAVGESLMSERASLPALALRLRPTHRVSQLKRCLVILEQHNLVHFSLDEKRVYYSVNAADVLRLASSSRCAFTVKTLFGEVAEAICEELVARGRLCCSECVRRVAAKLEVSVDEVKEKFARLSETQLVIRCARVETTLYGCPTFEHMVDPFIMPELILTNAKGKAITETSSRKRKASSSEDTKYADEAIYWRVNYERFERYMRDELVLDAATSGEPSTKLLMTARALLKVCELKADSSASTSHPVSVFEVSRCATANSMNLERWDVERALEVLGDINGVIRKVGDSAGGMYVVDFEKAVTIQCQRAIESVIREKFDSRAVRVFRLLLQTGYLEEEQIEKQAMFTAKDTKELLYFMLEDHFVSIRHVPKTTDFAPGRTFCLYYVNIGSVAQTMYINLCKALRNVILRRCSETKSLKLLIDRQLKMETIMSNIEMDPNLDDESKAQQMAEVEDMYLTPADVEKLEDYRRGQIAFLCTEVELEKDILLFKLFIEFSRRRL